MHKNQFRFFKINFSPFSFLPFPSFRPAEGASAVGPHGGRPHAVASGSGGGGGGGGGDGLPSTLEVREDGEDAFVSAITTEVNGGVLQFKLAPTYTLYLALRLVLQLNRVIAHPLLRKNAL